MYINKLVKVNINNSEQWILVRGESAGPLVIHVQQGPGLPMICEAGTMKKLFNLEDHCLVVYWDQRGCGKSYYKTLEPRTINFAQLTDDLISCTQYLLNAFKKDKVIVIGYSIGATLSLMAAAKNSIFFSQLFLVGIDVDAPYANEYAYEFALNRAKETDNKKLIRQVMELNNFHVTDSKRFQERAKIMTNSGGIKKGSSYNELLRITIMNLLFSSAYRLGDILKTIKGMEFCANALLPELNTLNLFDKVTSVDVPIHFIQGKYDAVAPYHVTMKFYDYLNAEQKGFIPFENSAHMPQYEEPEKFGKLLKEKIGIERWFSAPVKKVNSSAKNIPLEGPQ